MIANNQRAQAQNAAYLQSVPVPSSLGQTRVDYRSRRYAGGGYGGTSYLAGSGPTIVGGSGTYQRIGNTTFGPNGRTYQQMGNTTFGPNGQTWQRLGNTTFGPNGQTIKRIGNTTFVNP